MQVSLEWVLLLFPGNFCPLQRGRNSPLMMYYNYTKHSDLSTKMLVLGMKKE